jgi:hypothetical protein
MFTAGFNPTPTTVEGELDVVGVRVGRALKKKKEK